MAKNRIFSCFKRLADDVIYSSGFHLRIKKAQYSYVVNLYFHGVQTEVESAATAEPSCLIFITTKSFTRRYCITLFLKGYEKYNKSKWKGLNLDFKMKVEFLT